ncbi:MAG: hypothetical protein ACYDBJ_11220 [Aggregatilineales bacterium]
MAVIIAQKSPGLLRVICNPWSKNPWSMLILLDGTDLREMLRQFAEEKLVASGEQDSIRFRHLD